MPMPSTPMIARVLIAGLLAGGLLAILDGCQQPEEPPPAPPRPSRLPDPPQVRDVTLARPETLRVGDLASIVLDAVDGQIPIVWRIEGLPEGWERTTSAEGRFYNLSGRLPLGSSETGVDITASVTDSNGRRSRPLPIHLDVVPRTYEFQPTLLSESDDGRTKNYELRLRAMPNAAMTENARIEIWVDTAGLSGGAAGDPDTIRLWDDVDDGLDIEQPVAAGDGVTATGAPDSGETFVIRSAAQFAALADNRARLTIRSASNPDFRIFMVRVTAH